MRKLIAAINMTLDGYGDHTAINPDEQIHRHYTDLLNSTDEILYGRVTYQLMEYWPTVLEAPTGNPATDAFAQAIDKVTKIVFSRTLKEVSWRNTRLATASLEEEVKALKQQPGRDIFVGSPSLILQTLQLGLLDELQLCVHPVIAGKGRPLFTNVDRVELTLRRTKTFDSGAVISYYKPVYQ